MFNEYPYTDYHELNTDWIIGKIKNVETAEANTKQYAEDADADKVAAEDARDIAVHAKDVAVEAKDDAVEAKDDAISFLNDTKDQLDLLQARVDNIIPDGTQTAGNTELLDIRVGANSYTYDSAGNAVRGQVSDIETALGQFDNISVPTYTITSDYYISQSGHIASAAGYMYSSPIAVSAGSIVVFIAAGHLTSVSMIATCDSDGSNILRRERSIDDNRRIYTFTATEDCYIAVSCQTTEPYQLYIGNEDVFDGRIRTDILGTKTVSTVTLNTGYYISFRGITAASSPFSYTDPVHVDANSLVILKARGSGTNVSMISRCDASGDNIITEVLSIDGNEHVYSYFATEECYVIFSHRHDRAYSYAIYTDGAYNTALSTLAEDCKSINILTAFNNITCIGDSLTYSLVYTDGATRKAYVSYPDHIGVRTGATITELATSGMTAKAWWHAYENDIDAKTNQLTIIYLGTNEGLSDTIDDDIVGPDYNLWADTNTGSYGKIIAKSLAAGSRVVLIKCVETEGDLATTNRVIEQLGEKFNVAVIDNKKFTENRFHSYPDGTGYNNVHYNDFGYQVFADQVIYNISHLGSDMMTRIIPE